MHLSQDRIQQTIQRLRDQDRAVLPSPDLPPEQHSMYYWAADYLQENLRPNPAWDYWGLRAIFYGVFAMPDHREFADVLLFTLEKWAAHLGPVPPMLEIVPALNDYLMPDDTWIVAPTLAELSTRLAGHEPWTCDGIIHALGIVRDPRLRAFFLPILETPGHEGAMPAGLALAEMGEPRALAPLLVLLRQKNEPDAATALGRLRNADAVPDLLAKLSEYRAPTGKRANTIKPMLRALIEALGHIGDPRAIEPLSAIFTGADKVMAFHAAIALSRLGDVRGHDLIIAQHTRRWECAKRLVELGDSRGLDALIKHYQDDPHRYPSGKRDYSDRRNIIFRLSREGDSGDIPLLQWIAENDEARTDQGWTLAESARRAIKRIEARKRVAL